MPKHTFIDLFCGCGGFSLGLERAGFEGLAAIDCEPSAMKIFKANFPGIRHALEKDLTAFSPADLADLLGTRNVDLIVGGPPCQGFSMARKVDGANHGASVKDDPRRVLYKKFLDHVDHFKPKVFVMENVLGIRSADGGIYYSKVQAEARKIGYKVHSQIEECVKLGVPQKRRRQLFIGTREDLPAYFRPILKPADRAMVGTQLGDAIGDLPELEAGEGDEETHYDFELRAKACCSPTTSNYLFNVLEVDRAAMLTAHRARPHNDRDLRDFALLDEGESSAEAMRRGIDFEFPYDKSTFKDRFTRQHRDRPCSTIVAHLAKDGLMFIHPTQSRSLTPREAARIQSFPDWFQMPGARTHQFKALGNAVPPLVSEAVGNAVGNYISKVVSETPSSSHSSLISLPSNDQEAADYIMEVALLSSADLKRCPINVVKSAWYSIGFLYMGLHPDSVLQHGTKILENFDPISSTAKIDPLLVSPYYEQSGWPVILTDFANEAWRLYDLGELSDDEFYCCDAQRAGWSHRVSTEPDENLAVIAHGQ